LKIPGKAFLKSESRTSVTCKLHSIVFYLKAIYQWQQVRYHEKNVKNIKIATAATGR